MKTKQKGQGLAEYAVVLVIVAVVVLCILACFSIVPLVLGAGVVAAFWHPISIWGTRLWSGIQEGNPASIMIGIVVLVAIFYVARWLVRRRH